MIDPNDPNNNHERAKEIESLDSANGDLSPKIFVNLGCGFKVLDGWINVDKYIEGNDKISNWDLSDLELANGSVDLLYSSHSLEHMLFKDAVKSLQEWFRVLKREGLLIIAIPDVEEICKHYHEKPDWYNQCLYGLQTGPGQIHYYGYTERTLRIILERLGFKILKLEKYYYGGCPSLWCEAEKNLI